MGRADTGEFSARDEAHDLSRCREVRLTLLKDVQQDVDVDRDGHLYFAAR